MTGDKIIPSSFRDPSGFVFRRDRVLYRQVNNSYRENYDLLMSSGLYDKLTSSGLLIPHDEIDMEPAVPETCYRILRLREIPFISYPYEWCFSQLKDAALTTLAAQNTALEHGMILKDASAYNIQFLDGRPVLIDTLSFEKYIEGEPWVAYRQFCQHFLGPLALMSYTDIRLGLLLRDYIDGLPLDLISRLLPRRTRFSFGALTHLHLHARSQKRYEGASIKNLRRKMSRQALRGLIDSLETCTEKLTWLPNGTVWADYYDNTNYSPAALAHKEKLVAEYLEQAKPVTVWDLGANDGHFSRLAVERKIPVIAFDIDHAAVEKNYREVRARNEAGILPLLLDLTNPSPSLGWANRERMSLFERGPADTVMALALVHHLAIANNLPFQKIASFLNDICHYLIIEFIPRDDSQVQRLLASREDIFEGYTREAFENTFQEYFDIENSENIEESERTLYLMQKK
jgi:cyclopropane fatty-acyl-phospholipid synthase-like methyltransferase